MGCRGSKVRILSPRPIPSKGPHRTMRALFTSGNFDRSPPPKEKPERGFALLTLDTEGRPAPAPSPTADEQLRLLLEAVTDYAIFTLDAQGRIMSWNRGAERLKGYR